MSYSADFFASRKYTALASAREIVPWVLTKTGATSVVDVGCGTGSWLSCFLQNGIDDVVGVDGPWVRRDDLEIPADKFVCADFTRSESLDLNRRFDLAISLEVAEHLPHAWADQFISSLARLAPCVLFSAAIPQQGGVGHVNEQWPDYWIGKFQRKQLICIDIVRGAFWDNPAVAPWYAQNTFFFINESVIPQFPRIIEERDRNSMAFKPLIHPHQYARKIQELTNPRAYSLRAIVRNLPQLLISAVRRRMGVRRCE